MLNVTNIYTRAYPGFSKGGGEESARSAGFEPNAMSDNQRAKGKFCAKLRIKPIGNLYS